MELNLVIVLNMAPVSPFEIRERGFVQHATWAKYYGANPTNMESPTRGRDHGSARFSQGELGRICMNGPNYERFNKKTWANWCPAF